MHRKIWATSKHHRTLAPPIHNTRTLPMDEGRTLHVCMSGSCAYRAIVDWSTHPFTTMEMLDASQPRSITHRLLREVES